jgi:hypothetical protein
MRYKCLIFCIFWYVLYGCTTQKKAIRYFDNNNTEAADYCADRFPIRETVDTIEVQDTALLYQYEVEFNHLSHLLDSLLIANCDTVYVDRIIQVIKKLPSKPEIKYIVKSQENTARSQVILDSCNKMSSLLNKKLDKEVEKVKVLTDKCEKYKRQRNRYLWWVLLLIVWTLRKPIIKLIK